MSLLHRQISVNLFGAVRRWPYPLDRVSATDQRPVGQRHLAIDFLDGNEDIEQTCEGKASVAGLARSGQF
jgi:hypothetical protein